MDRGNNIPERRGQEWDRVPVQAPLQANGGQEVAQTTADVSKSKEQVVLLQAHDSDLSEIWRSFMQGSPLQQDCGVAQYGAKNPPGLAEV